MRILLTGASSFTGFWFAKQLAAAGHTVVAPLRSARDGYVSGPRAARVRGLADVAEIVEGVTFGDDRFMDLVKAGPWDLLCHHAAQVADYRSPDFDVVTALRDNTRSLRAVLAGLAAAGLKSVVLTGSVFEQDEGAGDPPLLPFSAYGLSKGLTYQTFRLRCHEVGLPLGKFVIPNPFGPLEEPRFCAYLLKCWRAGTVASVRTPDYVRDNIHVDLLALSYAGFVAAMGSASASVPQFCRPSGYVETQGAFTLRYADAMRGRLGLPCDVLLEKQTAFEEPLMRVNTQSAAHAYPHWSEQAAWDAVADAHRATA